MEIKIYLVSVTPKGELGIPFLRTFAFTNARDQERFITKLEKVDLFNTQAFVTITSTDSGRALRNLLKQVDEEELPDKYVDKLEEIIEFYRNN